MIKLNYQHLRYFYEVATHGSISRAAEKNFVTPQTISAQIQQLEERIGQALFERKGRRLSLTPAGEFARVKADQIFGLGDQLAAALTDAPGKIALPIAIGITDSVPKLMASMSLQALLDEAPQRELIVEEGSSSELLNQLVTNQLHAVLTDHEPTIDTSFAIQARCLVNSSVTIMGNPKRLAELEGDFPACLNHQPFIIWSRNSALNSSLLAWFKREKIKPHIVARCSDSALMKSLASNGLGLMAAPSVIVADIAAQHQLQPIAEVDVLQTSLWLAQPASSQPLAIRWPGSD